MPSFDEMLQLIDDENMRHYDLCCSSDECQYCDSVVECYSEALAKAEQEFARSINFGGFSTEELFWENF